jgi:hypothetical protein
MDERFVKVKIDDFIFKVRPPNPQAVAFLHNTADSKSKDDVGELLHLIKVSVKGLSNENGGIYKLEFDGHELSFKCMKDLLLLGREPILKLGQVCASLLKDPRATAFRDGKNQEMKGVEWLSSTSGSSN